MSKDKGGSASLEAELFTFVDVFHPNERETLLFCTGLDDFWNRHARLRDFGTKTGERWGEKTKTKN